ncbi:MAG: hypothetical protein M0Z56_11925 [Desulfobacteraceae bacterium]|nr:hypothetical protein [Desulfobacteraceae bacterium]
MPETLSHEIRETLETGFNVTHAVLQFESSDCGNGELLCRMGGGKGHDHSGHEHHDASALAGMGKDHYGMSEH